MNVSVGDYQESNLTSQKLLATTLCLVVRLEYVHARAAAECWTEEVEILECEMAAVVRWFEQEAMKWIRRGSAVAEEERSYRVYCCHQFSLDQKLADTAIGVFTSVVGGDDAWDRIWNKSTPMEEEGDAMQVD